MAWFSDPELYLGDSSEAKMTVYRIRKTFGSPLVPTDFNYTESYPVTDHLALLGNSFPWKKSDYDALAAFIHKNDLYVNCQGLACTMTFPREKPGRHPIYFRSNEVVDLRRYGLPAVTVPFRAVHYIESGGLAAVESSPKENELAAKLAATITERDQERAEKQSLEKKNSSLQGKLYTEIDQEREERRILERLIEKSNTERDQEREERRILEKENSSLQEMLNSEIDKERAERRILEDNISKITEELNAEREQQREEKESLKAEIEKYKQIARKALGG